MVTMYKLVDCWGRMKFFENDEKRFISKLKQFILDGRQLEEKSATNPLYKFRSSTAGFKLVDGEWQSVVVSDIEIEKAYEKRLQREYSKRMKWKGYGA